MSPEYLEKTFASFAHPDGFTIILNGTAGAGTVRGNAKVKLYAKYNSRALMYEVLMV